MAYRSWITADCPYEDLTYTSQQAQAMAYRNRITADCQYEDLTSTTQQAQAMAYRSSITADCPYEDLTTTTRQAHRSWILLNFNMRLRIAGFLDFVHRPVF
jgi:hypothetical protein